MHILGFAKCNGRVIFYSPCRIWATINVLPPTVAIQPNIVTALPFPFPDDASSTRPALT